MLRRRSFALIDPEAVQKGSVNKSYLGQALSADEWKMASIDGYLVKPIKQSRLFDCLVKAICKTAPEGFATRSALFGSTPMPTTANPTLHRRASFWRRTTSSIKRLLWPNYTHARLQS